MNRVVVPFFCDECGRKLNTGSVCPECKRILCHKHYYGSAAGPYRRKDGLCVKCAQLKEGKDGQNQQA